MMPPLCSAGAPPLPSSGLCPADDQSMYQGWDWDTIRWAGKGQFSLPTASPDPSANPVPGAGIPGVDWRPLKDFDSADDSNPYVAVPNGGSYKRNAYGILNLGSAHSS